MRKNSIDKCVDIVLECWGADQAEVVDALGYKSGSAEVRFREDGRSRRINDATTGYYVPVQGVNGQTRLYIPAQTMACKETLVRTNIVPIIKRRTRYARLVNRLWSDIPSKSQQILKSKYVDNHTTEQSLACLELSLSTFNRHLKTGRDIIKRALRDENY